MHSRVDRPTWPIRVNVLFATSLTTEYSGERLFALVPLLLFVTSLRPSLPKVIGRHADEAMALSNTLQLLYLIYANYPSHKPHDLTLSDLATIIQEGR